MAMPLMIDSGAFSALYRGEEILLEDYIAFCHEIREDFPQAVFVNLDVIGDGEASFKNWIKLRDAGVITLPVYHVSTDEKWLRAYLKETDHIGLGAIAKRSKPKKLTSLDRIWENYLIDPETRLPKIKVHGMGITSFPLLRRYPWHSVDSTSWIRVAMFGHIHIPKRRKGTWDYSAPPTKIGFSNKSEDRRNKAKHLDNLSEAERGVLLRYMKEKGFILGFECKREGGGRVRLVGVSNYHGRRAELTLEFYAGFLGSMPWPRPFNPPRSSKGFGL